MIIFSTSFNTLLKSYIGEKNQKFIMSKVAERKVNRLARQSITHSRPDVNKKSFYTNRMSTSRKNINVEAHSKTKE